MDIRPTRQFALSRCARFAAAFLILIGFSSGRSAAEDYPARPITMVVPFAAGGPTDTLARLLAGPMSRTLGVNVLVEDVTGAAGTVGVGRVAHAAPDGYTISIGHWSTHVVNGAIYKLSYDLLRDFEPIALLPSNPMLIVSRTTVPARPASVPGPILPGSISRKWATSICSSFPIAAPGRRFSI